VCVYKTGLLLMFAYIALLLVPLSFVLGVGAPSLSLVGFIFVIKAPVRRGSLSFLWFVVASAACVYSVRDRLAACLRMSHFYCFRCASSSGFARRRFPSVASGSKLLDVAHCSLLHQLFLLCFGFALALALIVIAK